MPPRPSAPPATTDRVAPPPPSRRRHAAFLAVTLLFPVVVLALAEGVLRLTWRDGRLPLFLDATIDGTAYRVANPRVARRWFANEAAPPAPPPEPFAATKPVGGIRIFALGESTTAGFPFPRNGAFPRILRDMLRDAAGGRPVEVVNLGVPATNSYALVDEIDEVIAERPDAVVLYAGHNEYYGALGVGSTQGSVGRAPWVQRVYVRLLHLRTALALRELLARARGAGGGAGSGAAPSDEAQASFMETLARRQAIALGDPVFEAGRRQYEENLGLVLDRLRAAGVRVFVGSVVSNVRDQRPFASDANRAANGADATFDAARQALHRGDSAVARREFERARDLDVVRFRAPSAFDSVVRRVAESRGATYVPVAEAFVAASAAGAPGRELFLEHVHPTRAGAVLMARTFAESIARVGVAGASLDASRLAPPAAYDSAMALTRLDERIAEHTVLTLSARWPFVPANAQGDYRGTYRPTDFVDSLAFVASRGVRWDVVKTAAAREYERRGHADSAALEIRGLVRDAPFAVEPRLLLGAARLAAGDTAGAIAAYRESIAVRPTAEATRQLGVLAVQRRDLAEGIRRLRESLDLDPAQPRVLYQLSLAAGLAHDLETAREAAARLARIDPAFPGLAEWMQVIDSAPR